MSRVHDSMLLLPSCGGDTRLVVAEDSVGPDHRAVRRHIARHDRIRPHGGTTADAHRTEHFSARADEDVIFNYCKISAVFPGHDRILPAYGHLVHYGHPAAELHPPLDYDAHRHREEERRAD